jgi:hypothetical protein
MVSNEIDCDTQLLILNEEVPELMKPLLNLLMQRRLKLLQSRI